MRVKKKKTTHRLKHFNANVFHVSATRGAHDFEL